MKASKSNNGHSPAAPKTAEASTSEGAGGALKASMRGADFVQQEALLTPVQRSASQGSQGAASAGGGVAAGAVAAAGTKAGGKPPPSGASAWATAKDAGTGAPAASGGGGKRPMAPLSSAGLERQPLPVEGHAAADATHVEREAPGLDGGGVWEGEERRGGSGGGYNSNWLMGNGESRDFHGHRLVTDFEGGQGAAIRGIPTHDLKIDLLLAIANATGKLGSYQHWSLMQGKSGVELLEALHANAHTLAGGLESLAELVEEGAALMEEHGEIQKADDLRRHHQQIVEYQRRPVHVADEDPDTDEETAASKATGKARGGGGAAAEASAGPLPKRDYVVGEGLVASNKVILVYEVAQADDGTLWSRGAVTGDKRYARNDKEVSVSEVPAGLVGVEHYTWGQAEGFTVKLHAAREKAATVKVAVPEGTFCWEALPWKGLPWPDLK